ncbi:7209_t:CDS:1, partial [Cetraspora pellucida]
CCLHFEQHFLYVKQPTHHQSSGQSNNQYNDYKLVFTQDAANTLQDEDVD